MGSIVLWAPLLATDVAELMAAAAGHMVAAIVLLNHHPTRRAPPAFELLKHELYLKVVTVSLVLVVETRGTELHFAFLTF
jgi:hypothetical protein